MTLQSALGGTAITQAPKVDCRLLVAGSSSCKLGGLLRIPRNSAHRLAALVVQGQDVLLLLHIPYSYKASTATSGQDVRCLLLFVPVQAFDVVRSCSCAAQSERVGHVVQIVNEDLAFGARRREQVVSVRVPLQRLDGTAVFRRPRDQRVAGARSQLLGIPHIDRAVLQGACNGSERVLIGGLAPGDVVEARVGGYAGDGCEVGVGVELVEAKVPQLQLGFAGEVIVKSTGASTGNNQRRTAAR